MLPEALTSAWLYCAFWLRTWAGVTSNIIQNLFTGCTLMRGETPTSPPRPASFARVANEGCCSSSRLDPPPPISCTLSNFCSISLISSHEANLQRLSLFLAGADALQSLLKYLSVLMWTDMNASLYKAVHWGGVLCVFFVNRRTAYL